MDLKDCAKLALEEGRYQSSTCHSLMRDLNMMEEKDVWYEYIVKKDFQNFYRLSPAEQAKHLTNAAELFKQQRANKEQS